METFTTETRLFLGVDIPDGETVTEKDFGSFLSECVTLFFPGFTVTTGTGYWNGEPEGVRVLTVLHNGGRDIGELECIAEAYTRKYNQEAVLVVHVDVSGRLV